ncbi:MAG: glycosyltransferase family 4 protein [Candidatus Baldrarchaeia archaeon]
MKVLEVYSSFLPKHGGVQRHMYDLCRRLVERGHKSIILTWTPSMPLFEIIDGIMVHRIRMARLFNFTRYPMIFYLSLHMMHLTRKYNIDIIHAHDYLPGLAAVLTGVFLNKPVVTTFHLPIQTTTFCLPSYLSPLLLIEKILKKLFISWAVVICVSKFTYEETLKLGFPSSKLKIIYNWVTSSPIKNKLLKGTLKKFNLNGKRYILSVGRLSEKQKNFSMLISAFKLLLDKGYKLDLVIVGEGPDKEAYQKHCSRLSIENNVHFLSNVSDIDLATLYKKCELFVLPSRLEGLPLVLLEAMNYGKSIVATKVGGIPEVVEDGGNGLLVDPNFSALFLGIETLLSTPHLKDAFGKRSKEVVSKKFSKRNCEATITFLEKILRIYSK